jgi:hypothetical protein
MGKLCSLEVGRFARTIQTATTAKTISEDSAFIDYTRGNLGVRVWKDRCQTIARDGDGAPPRRAVHEDDREMLTFADFC